MSMYVIIWEYRVKRGKQSEFEAIYSSNGAWAKLFKKDAGYLGTTFIRDTNDPQRYITIDRWTSKEAYENFLTQREKEYKALDANCEGLTEQESQLGMWNSV
jgi:heme-degrading monooxygenase HmoA